MQIIGRDYFSDNENKCYIYITKTFREVADRGSHEILEKNRISALTCAHVNQITAGADGIPGLPARMPHLISRPPGCVVYPTGAFAGVENCISRQTGVSKVLFPRLAVYGEHFAAYVAGGFGPFVVLLGQDEAG